MADLALGPNAPEVHLDEISLENYALARQIGKGKYSVVFRCTDAVLQQPFAVKVFKEKEKQKKIRREVTILKHLAGGPNIISLADVVEDAEGLKRGLVLELVDYNDFRSLFPRLRDADMRFYLAELTKALQFCHGRGVMHRDIRPHNVVIDHAARKLRLVGWGSAEFHEHDKEYSVRVGLFKPPELLLDHQAYDCSLDMWALGSMAAAMVFRREPFFHGSSASDQLVNMARVLGTDALFDYVDRCRIELDRDHAQLLDHVAPRPWTSFVTRDNERTATPEALDFLDKLLRFDHEDRLTAEQALSHPYLQPVPGEMGLSGGE